MNLKNNRALRNLFLFNGIFCLAGALLGPLYAVFVQGITDKIFWISAAWATGIFSTTVFALIISKIGDKFDDKNLLLAGFLIRAIAWFCFIFVNSIPTLLANMVLIGFGEAVGSPAFNAIFAEHLDDACHVGEYSDWSIVANLLTAAGTLVGGYVASRLGFKPIFMFMSGLALFAFWGVYTKRTAYDLYVSKKKREKVLAN